MFHQPKFDPAAPVATRKRFRYAGRDYAPGEKFEVDPANPRAARKLYDGRFLRLSDDRELVVHHRPGGLRIVQRSPGWYDVLDAEDRVLTPRAIRKKAAEALVVAGAVFPGPEGGLPTGDDPTAPRPAPTE